MKVGDKVEITNDFCCREQAKKGESGKITEFEYTINDWWNGENSRDYRVTVKLDRQQVKNIYVSLFLSDLKKVT